MMSNNNSPINHNSYKISPSINNNNIMKMNKNRQAQSRIINNKFLTHKAPKPNKKYPVINQTYHISTD